jgi:hypothetical protein
MRPESFVASAKETFHCGKQGPGITRPRACSRPLAHLDADPVLSLYLIRARGRLARAFVRAPPGDGFSIQTPWSNSGVVFIVCR